MAHLVFLSEINLVLNKLYVSQSYTKADNVSKKQVRCAPGLNVTHVGLHKSRQL